MRRAIFILPILILFGCSFPQWRIFQKKIDPKLAEEPTEKVEAQRQGAAFIVGASATVQPDPAAQIATIHAVAEPLSASLGQPKKAVLPADQDKVIKALRTGLLAEQARAEQWRAFAKKYANKPIEDTGINLAGPAGLLILVGIIVLCIACPPIGYAILRVLPVLWGFFKQASDGVEKFVKNHPEAGSELQSTLSKKMDEAQKRIVRLRFNRAKT